MLLWIEGGEVYEPEPRGRASVLVGGGKVLAVGKVDRKAVEKLDPDYYVIDAAGRVVTPGFIDPHEHLLGGSGEGGFSAQTPEIRVGEIVLGGITTVVGTLGVDTTMKNMPGLVGRAKALREQGLTAFCWTGGYDVPPGTVTGSVRGDILFIEEGIGGGEIAFGGQRATELVPQD